MRITFVLPHAGMAGGTRVVAIYAERLKARGHDVTVISTPRKPVAWRRKVKCLLKGKGWPDTRDEGPSHMDGVDVDHRVIERWRPVMDADVPDADVVVATWWETAEWVAGLSPTKGAKAYFVQHHETHPGQPLERVRATYGLPMHKITISTWLAGIMGEAYGDGEVSLVPNSVDCDRLGSPCRAKGERTTIGTMYSRLNWKGSDIAIEACRIARSRLQQLRVVGFGLQPPKAAEAAVFDDYVETPEQDCLSRIYAGADAWLFSSRKEGFGLPILEAMACRTPVIGTPAGAAPELIGDGGGILLSGYEPEEMAAAIVRVAEMTETQWRQMSDAAYATASAYTWEDATDRFERALLRAVERRAELTAGVGVHV